jgi:hypothetical protein
LQWFIRTEILELPAGDPVRTRAIVIGRGIQVRSVQSVSSEHDGANG